MSAHNDTEFLRFFGVVLGGLMVFTVIIIGAARYVGSDVDERNNAGDPMMDEIVAKRIAPVGQVRKTGEAVAEAAAPAPAATPAKARSGAEVYQAVCMACHTTGAAGAPKIGDKAAWEPRMAGGVDALAASAIKGKGAMPPRGGVPTLSDDEVHAAIEHILAETGLMSAAPAVPAAAPAPEMAAPAAAAVEPAAPEPAAAAPAAGGIDLAKGQQLYQQSCFACHGTGAAGAPKLGDKAAWASRVAKGADALIGSAIHGLGAMPPKGGNPALSDVDIADIVGYMVQQSQ